MEAAWKAVLVESDRRNDLHSRVKDDLQMKVLSYMSKLVERLEHIYIFCGHFRTKADFTLRIF